MSRTTDAAIALAFAVALAAFFFMVVSASPASAGSPWRDWQTTYGFKGPLERQVDLNTAIAIKSAYNGAFNERGVIPQAAQQNIDKYYGGGVTAYSVGNQSMISCSSDSYCNVDQDNDDSVQNAQNNSGGTLNAGQAGDDIETDVKYGGKGGKNGYPE